MSLILEALRKSEAERRRSTAPDLARELPPVAVLLPAARWRWWLAAAALAAAGLAFAAWSLRPTPHAAARAAGTGGAPSSAAARATGDGARTAAPTAHSAAWPEVARIAHPAPPTDAGSGAAGAARAVDGAGADAAVLGRSDSRTPAPVYAPPVAETPALPAQAGDAELAAAGLGTGAPATGELRLSALPPNARARLPALKLTLHLWNEEPAQRFVILDGVRLGVGDRIGAGMVAAIDADGVVIAFEGQRVRLPLR